MLDELAAKAETPLTLETSCLGGNLGGSRAGAQRTNGGGGRDGGPTRDDRGLRDFGVRSLRSIGTRCLIHQTTRQRHRPLKQPHQSTLFCRWHIPTTLSSPKCANLYVYAP